ncbi:MAG TPA: hypothetical protein VMG36_04710 [Thermoplasmata archaeon]|nr:hypothetical protein [Thermoplasmata archaeon]
MPPDRAGGWLSALRQGFELDVDFGTHSIEAMTWIAEVVETSVYRRGSLRGTADGLRFALANPPLRLGAFSGVTLRVNGALVPPERWTIRSGSAAPPRAATTVGAATPIELRSGEAIEVVAAVGRLSGTVRIRLELESVAIPPRVWMEFDDELREDAA